MGDAGNGPGGGQEADKDRLIEELREAVRARDEFVAIAAHELRNPMTPILMQVHNLAAAARSPRRCRPEVLAPRLELLEHAVREFVRRWTARASRRGWRAASWRRTCRTASWAGGTGSRWSRWPRTCCPTPSSSAPA